ncbi:MAG: sugar ABC transporter permease [Spirochaetaceae bacterium]|jgi:multiple sugar transport system permease protein|nr:sugar ABC transporter permease [Spirochaetaceae bacterium]
MESTVIKPLRRLRVSPENAFPIFAMSFSLAGFALFYLIPFLISAAYAFTENPIKMRFVGFQNFIDIFKNKFFLLGLKNTFIFMIFAIPLSIVSALGLALALKKLARFINLFSIIFLIPLVLPSATTAHFWTQVFAPNGALNGLLYKFGISGPNWLAGNHAMGVMIFIYIWKTLGYNTVLFMAGLNSIPYFYYDCASVLGAGTWRKFKNITLVYLTPTFFLVFMMSFVNSFKIFREVYLIEGEFPPDSVYLLQYFVNNTLLSLHYHRLVSAVYVLTLIIVIVVVVSFRFENRFSENLSD